MDEAEKGEKREKCVNACFTETPAKRMKNEEEKREENEERREKDKDNCRDIRPRVYFSLFHSRSPFESFLFLFTFYFFSQQF